MVAQKKPNVSSTTIIRANHGASNAYFLMLRETAQDKNLTYEELGLLTSILSRPDHWRIIPKTLHRARSGRDVVYKLLSRLIALGYCQKQTVRQKGKIKAVIYTIYEKPLPETSEEAFTVNGKTRNGKTRNDNRAQSDSTDSEILQILDNTDPKKVIPSVEGKIRINPSLNFGRGE